jgi:hypothetical protein
VGERVYLRAAPPQPFGTIARDVARAFLLYAGVDPLNLGSHEGQGYLLALAPFDPALTLDIPGPPMPFGCIDRRLARSFTSQGRAVTIYPAATGNAARSSTNDDTPAATWVPGKLSGAFNYEINLSLGADGGGSATVGILELLDPDGELDDLRTLGWDGAPLMLMRGEPDAAFSTFSTVARLSTAGLRYNARKKEILLRDLAWQLTQAELHGQRYGGTGGTDGDPSLAGQIKPLAIGSVFNISPVQINATSLIYQVSCSSVLAIDAVRDGGAPLAFSADYGTYDLLAAAMVAPGAYASCIALGLFRLGSAPVYLITADVRGDNDVINGLSYPHTRAQIARRIATGRGNIRLGDPDQLDLAALEALEQRQTATLGYFWDREITKAAALAEVMVGCLGWPPARGPAPGHRSRLLVRSMRTRRRRRSPGGPSRSWDSTGRRWATPACRKWSRRWTLPAGSSMPSCASSRPIPCSSMLYAAMTGTPLPGVTTARGRSITTPAGSPRPMPDMEENDAVASAAAGRGAHCRVVDPGRQERGGRREGDRHRPRHPGHR